MWRGDIYIYYKEGTLPNPDSADTLCFFPIEAPNRDMALMQVMDHHNRSTALGASYLPFHPESPYPPRLNTITGFKFRAYGKKRKRLTNLQIENNLLEEIKNG